MFFSFEADDCWILEAEKWSSELYYFLKKVFQGDLTDVLAILFSGMLSLVALRGESVPPELKLNC